VILVLIILYHLLTGNGATAGSSGSSKCLFYDRAVSIATQQFLGFVIDILDYADTNKYKTVRLFRADTNGWCTTVQLFIQVLASTSAINQLTLMFTGSTLAILTLRPIRHQRSIANGKNL
jgi:hypothetical protein